jgi:hypothetical protein
MPAPARDAAVVVAIPNAKKRPKGVPERWLLWQLIAVAKQVPLCTADTIQQLELTQNYRNLIHPGRAIRSGERCGKDTALGALSGLERIIREAQS